MERNKNYKRLIGILILLLGVFLLFNNFSSFTGNAILSFQSVLSFNSILCMVLILSGLFFMVTGNLESRTNGKKYDGVIILGGNWRGYPSKLKPVKRDGKEILDISLRSKMNCIVAGDMYSRGITDKIIIGTGKTAGRQWPSEAEAMKDYLLRRFPEIEEGDIMLQTRNLDTYEELDEDLKLAREHGLVNLALATVNTQLPRVIKYLEGKGENLDYISSEEEFARIDPRYKKLAIKYSESRWVKYYETFKEYVLRGLQSFGLTSRITKPLAKIIRR